MATYSAQKIATFFLATADLHEASLINLKLQKLLYYAQGYSLAIAGRPLFSALIEAWANGPVVPSVWRVYRGYGSDPISPPKEFSWDDYTDDDEKLLNEVWNEYGQFSAWRLRDMAHSEPPWKIAHDKGLSTVISKKAMKRFFKRRLF